MCLIILKVPTNDLYDVVQFEPKVKPGVSVEAVRKIWNQRAEQAAQSQHAPTLPPKSTRNTQVCTANIYIYAYIPTFHIVSLVSLVTISLHNNRTTLQFQKEDPL